MTADMTFDRTVSDELMTALTKGSPRSLVSKATGQSSKPLYDLQLRRIPKSNSTRASLYYGMTALLHVDELNGRFRLTADKTYMALDSFDDRWAARQPLDDLDEAWPQVERYLAEVSRLVADGSALRKEGPVHAALASGNSDAYRVIQREARPSFRDKRVRDRRLGTWITPFNEALAARAPDDPKDQGWWPTDVRVGSSLDFLAVDIGGRLALIEAKADNASAKEIAKVAVQAGVYAAMFADLLAEGRPDAFDAIARMLEQRARLGLSRPGVLHVREKGQVVPVVAIGPGDPNSVGPGRPSAEVHRRMWAVARAVDTVRGNRVDPIEVWYLDRAGRIAQVERFEDLERAERLG